MTEYNFTIHLMGILEPFLLWMLPLSLILVLYYNLPFWESVLIMWTVLGLAVYIRRETDK